MRTADSGLRAHNQFQVFRLFLDGHPRTREEAVSRTGLSRSTVEKVFVKLRGMDAIEVVGQRASRGGRPHDLYGLNPSFRYFVAADFSIPDLTVAVMDLAFEVVHRRDTVIDWPQQMPAREAIRLLSEGIVACLKGSGVPETKVLALNLSLPGPIIAGHSTIQNRDVLDWADVPLVAELETRLGLRTYVKNDVVNMMTTELESRGQVGANLRQGLHNTLFLALRRGSNAELRVGAAYAIPSTGSLQVFPGSLTHYATGLATSMCRCGSRGCLERALQDLGPPEACAPDEFRDQVASILTPVLNSICRFTEAQRVILDLTGAGEHASRLQEQLEERLQYALSQGPLHDTVVEAAAAPADASLRGAALSGLQQILTLAEPADLFFDNDQDAWGLEASQPSMASMPS